MRRLSNGREYSRLAIPPLSMEEQNEIGRLIAKGTQAQSAEAKDRLVRSVIPLAIKIASQFVQSHSSLAIDMDDAIGAAFLGVSRCLDSFDFTRGTRFSTYAGQAITSHLTQMSHAYIHDKRHTLRLDEACIQGGEPASPDEDPSSLTAREESLADLRCRLSRLPEMEKECLVHAAGIDGTANSTRELMRKFSLRGVRKIREIARRALIELGGEPTEQSARDLGFGEDVKRKPERQAFVLTRWLLDRIESGPIDYAEASRLAAENRYPPASLDKQVNILKLCVAVEGYRKVIVRRPADYVARRRRSSLAAK